ncbi:PREDICTED: uncharacterized protein LOC104759211 [Camelina sativa]|uniref:Uncharacterized protein LOC104759211 n=1 Tax=Camelina sativa TaxID=90675 RepID=A0ABM0X4E8_CAMSA|nr:PREDICTED: uncharacterized protein LOC104759211 [Camelina sativa]
MGITSSADLKPENPNPKSQNNSEELGDDDSSSSSVWRDRLREFMEEGGGCKESYNVFRDCTEEAEKNNESIGKCLPMLNKCMEAHSDYYQPILAAEKAALERLTKGFNKLPTVGKVSDHQQNDEEEEEEEERVLAFLKGGACKDSFMAWLDCSEEAERNKQDFITKCARVSATLSKCLDDHSDYYHPVLTLAKTAEEHMEKELEAFSLPEASLHMEKELEGFFFVFNVLKIYDWCDSLVHHILSKDMIDCKLGSETVRKLGTKSFKVE